jgi:MATE family multidrug resistance protein
MTIPRAWTRYWHSEAGPREVLQLAIPLILGMFSWTIQVFVDRLFLTWYSQAAIAASVPAVCVLWVVIGALQGIVSFSTTFVAQYHGAGRRSRIGPALAQSVLLAAGGGAAILAFWPAAPRFFDWVGHDTAVRDLEVVYFQILLFSGAPTLVTAAVTGFFSGLGRTWIVLWIHVLATVVNVVLDYAWIFGVWGFPRWGIAGAAWATVAAQVAGAALALGLVWLADPTREFAIRCAASWRPEPALMRRYVRFGGPNALWAMVDILAWTWFALLVGRLGTLALAATNIAFNVNLIAFVPMMGLGVATQTLVGQRLGQDRPDLATRATWTAYWLAGVYTLVMGASYVLVPDLFLAVFRSRVSADEYAPWHDTVVGLLRFVAVYALFDMSALIFCGALRGAGDTRFVMATVLGLSLTVLALPSYIACEVFGAGLYTAWACCTVYVTALGLVAFWRFQSGVWQRMRVIELELPDTDEPDGAVTAVAEGTRARGSRDASTDPCVGGAATGG